MPTCKDGLDHQSKADFTRVEPITIAEDLGEGVWNVVEVAHDLVLKNPPVPALVAYTHSSGTAVMHTTMPLSLTSKGMDWLHAGI
jgi:hypothetical protein